MITQISVGKLEVSVNDVEEAAGGELGLFEMSNGMSAIVWYVYLLLNVREKWGARMYSNDCVRWKMRCLCYFFIDSCFVKERHLLDLVN
jgi:hypothetical protein